MTPVKEIELISQIGMSNDAHAKANSERQILLLEEETLNALQLQPGIVKENITTSGIALMELSGGTRLRLGNEVILEITNVCHPCSRMEEIRPGLRIDLAGRRGMLARVVSGGVIRRGDSIQLYDGRE